MGVCQLILRVGFHLTVRLVALAAELPPTGSNKPTTAFLLSPLPPPFRTGRKTHFTLLPPPYFKDWPLLATLPPLKYRLPPVLILAWSLRELGMEQV